MFCVLSAYSTAERIFVTAVPGARRMASTENTAVFSEARLARLQLAPLLYASLPKVMTNVAEVGSTEAEVVRLPLATVPTLPTEELCAVLWALKLALRSTTTADKLHGEGGLHIIIQVILFVFLPTTLHFTPIVRLIALRAFEECHLRHR
jgi:hypothetical protein